LRHDLLGGHGALPRSRGRPFRAIGVERSVQIGGFLKNNLRAGARYLIHINEATASTLIII
jgi:hypothetical protein